jgi:hypothetical protein
VLDPFRPDEPVLSVVLPFYGFLIGALLVGVVLGGVVMWMTQGRWRRIARRRGADAVRWQAEADRLTASATSSSRPCASSPRPIAERRRAMMRFFDGAAVDAALSYPALIDILEAAFVKGAISPLRHHHAISLDGRPRPCCC